MDERKAMELRLKNKWEIVCTDADGLTKWREIHDNLIVNVGLQDLLTKYLKGSSYTAAWYKATFSINATSTIAGAFMVTDDTKSGTSGTLYGVVDFGSTRSVISGDTLEITVTLTSGN